MFSEPINRTYDMGDASIEIIIMLAVAFLLGYLLRWALTYETTPATKKQLLAIPPRYATFAKDDLKIIEGIGPKIESLLKAHDVATWKTLSETSPKKLKEILTHGGDRFAMHNPKSWPDQAALAYEGKWNELAEFQDILIGGR